ncbi:MAG: tripartite tricarboxylate transporter permease, partial [Deltaproteobacteria bacterium]|nr:tripartite tricarboxylate transporter permease [Deltaproteobacteria bacterium]
GILIIVALKLQQAWGIPDLALVCFLMGLVMGWAMINTLPSIFLGTPDEAAMFITLPGQKYLMQGRGHEAAVLTAAGGLGAVVFLGMAAPLLPLVLPPFKALIGPHLFWILGLMVVFMVMSEWPKGGDWGGPGRRFLDAWSSLLAGIATLALSGFLGFILLYRPIVPPEYAFQNIMPAFVGLYAVPWILGNILSPIAVPKQVVPASIDADQRVLTRAVAAGSGGGLFAAIFPIITGGMGGLLAGHATAQQDERAFVASQGASKVVYYVGAFLLLFVPGLALTRGGMAWMVQTIYVPASASEYWTIIGAVLLSGGVSFLLLLPLSRFMVWLVGRVNHRSLSWFTGLLAFGIVFWITGWQGVLITVVSTGIGMIPVYFHSRRMNCMGVLLIPVMLNMGGVGPDVAALLGLAT